MLLTTTFGSLLLLSAAASGADGGPGEAAAQRRMGELARAGDALGFAPCRGRVAAAVENDGESRARRLVRELNGGSDGAVFIDADVAQLANGSWRIVHIHRAYRDGPRCREDLGDYVWRAVAEDGSWTLQATTRYVSIRRRGHPAQFFRYRPFERAAAGTWVFAGQSESGAVNLVMRARPCRDDAAGLRTQWQAEFTLAGEAHRGCAWTGQPKVD